MFNKNLVFLTKKNFQIFEIENFLDENLYNNLKINFPLANEIDFIRSQESVSREKKFSFNNFNKREELYTECMSNNKAMQEFHNIIHSEEFFYFFYSKMLRYFLKNNSYSMKRTLKLLGFPKLTEKYTKTTIRNFFYSKFFVRIEYSYILNGGKVVPHTDLPGKLLSLMLYFPDNDPLYEDNQEEAFGTQFWDCNISNADNIHYRDEEEIKFLNNPEHLRTFKIKYKSNQLSGFARSPYAWHSADPIIFHENYIRKSININFFQA